MKNKRIFAIVLLLLTLFTAIFAFSSCDSDDVWKTVVYRPKKYGMKEVLCWCSIDRLLGLMVDDEYLSEDVYSVEKEKELHYMYCVGIRRNFWGTKEEEFALIFSGENGAKICETKWIFDTSFREMFEMLNARAGVDLYPEYTLCWIDVLNTLDDKEEMATLVPEIESIALDVPLMLHFENESFHETYDYAIVQSGGELLIFETPKMISDNMQKTDEQPQT